MVGEYLLLALAISCAGYFVYIQDYISDPQKRKKDAAWLDVWERQNKKRQIENEKRRPSLDGMFYREKLEVK